MTRIDLPYRVTLPIQLTNGNDGRGSRWFKSANIRNRMEKTLRQLGLARTPLDVPVAVTVTRVLGKGERKWDSSSGLRGNWKEIEDAMVACGWFHDDGPKWITETTFRQDDSRRKDGPAIIVEMTAEVTITKREESTDGE